MLQPLPQSTVPLSPHAHFHDSLHGSTYLLQEGRLNIMTTHNHNPEPVNIASSSIDPQYPVTPALLTIEGDLICNHSGNILTLIGQQATVRSSVDVINGSYWEWQAPLGLTDIQLGVCILKDNQILNYQLVDLNSSTSRTVTFTIKELSLNLWVNGTKPNKKSNKAIKFDPLTDKVYPCAKIKGKGNTLVFSPFLTTPVSSSTNFNPFGSVSPQPPLQTQVPFQPLNNIITKLVQLSSDRMLLIWSNNRLQLICRNKNTNNFVFPQTSIHKLTVSGLFSKQEYKLLLQWRGDKALFKESVVFELKNIYRWIKFLIQELDEGQEQKIDIYQLLLCKLLALRPYLHQIGERVANLSLHFQSDTLPFSEALRYFDHHHTLQHSLLHLQSPPSQLTYQGQIKDISVNYLITKKDNQIIIYHLGSTIKQVFRNNTNSLTFNKHDLINSYEEKDLRLFKKEDCHLYKILTSALSQRKKQQQMHLVNQHDLKELTNIFGIQEAAAHEALQSTGSVEDALVWIYSSHQNKSKKQKLAKLEGDEAVQSIQMVELKTMSTRLVLSINKTIILLGVLPKQLNKWIYLGQNQYIDLSSFKHEQCLQDINYEQFYQHNHPCLHIIDQITLRTPSELIYTGDNSIYVVTSSEKGLQSQKVQYKAQLTYEVQPSLIIDPLSSEIDPALLKKQGTRSIHGELIQSRDKVYHLDTTILIDSQLYTNSTYNVIQVLRVACGIDSQLFEEEFQEGQKIPLTIESGPPGVNRNYLLTNILQPNGSFLGNYPHGLRLRHIHGLNMQLTHLTLNRCLNRKNINYVQSGIVCLMDIWGSFSNPIPFTFGQNKEETKIAIKTSKYWKEILFQFKFTTFKKLPYEIGTIAASGTCQPQRDYISSLAQKLSKHINEDQTQKIFINNFKFKGIDKLELQISSQNILCLKDNLRKNKKLVINSCEQITVCREADSFEQMEQYQPKKLLNYMASNITTIPSFLVHLAYSHSFSLEQLPQPQVRKFVDLTALMNPYLSHIITHPQYYELMFNKMWDNTHAKEYFISMIDTLCQTSMIPLPYLQLLIAKMTSQQHALNLTSTLNLIEKTRSQQYRTLNTEQPYLYFQSQFYSNYYFNIIQPSNDFKDNKTFNQHLIHSEMAVFKGQYTKRMIIKLGSIHQIRHMALRVEPTQVPAKILYSVYNITSEGKQQVGSGCLQEHQWAQITKTSNQAQQNQKGLDLNLFALQVGKVRAQALQIQLKFTSTGILEHQTQLSKVIQVDIIPQLYGYQITKSEPISQLESLFTFNPEEMFFLSVSHLPKKPLKKYSISKDKNLQFIYYSPHRQDLTALKTALTDKIQKKQLQSIVALQRRLIKNEGFTPKGCLDYLYTLVHLSLKALIKSEYKLSDQLCNSIFTTLIKVAKGPIKLLAFRAISHKINLLIKSLQYIQYDMNSLGPVSFSYQQLLQTADLHNYSLCSSLTNLILKGVPYQPKWAQLLIKMVAKTNQHLQIIPYFIQHNDWLNNQVILGYLASLPQQIYITSFLNIVAFSYLSKLVLAPSAKPRMGLLLQAIVDRASETNPVDLDVVSLIFQQEPVRWQQLERVISSCPMASDVVIHHFLQTDAPQILASEHAILLARAASPKYAEQFAIFLQKIYQKDKEILSQLFLTLVDKCKTLHYDFLETIGQFITQLCNFGGLEGVRLQNQKKIQHLQTAVQMLKVAQKIPEGAQLPNQDLFIDWYLSNNDYELTSINPANKSPASHLMKTLVQQVHSLLKTSSPAKVLHKYTQILASIQHSKKHSLAHQHLLFNTLHHGASSLLASTLTPGSLSDVLVGGENPLLPTIIRQLKSNILKKTDSPPSKWSPQREIDVTDRFGPTDIPNLKDIQAGKGGSKSPSFKLALTQKNISIVSSTPQSPTKIIIGFCLNDHAENKTAILPSKVELYGGSDKTLFKIGFLTPIEDQFFFSYGVKLFGINLNAKPHFNLHALKKLQFRMHEPCLSSASEMLQCSQKSKKGATFNVSFVSVSAYDSLPSHDPDYSHMYLTLLSFLGQSKYQQDLNTVIKSSHFDQKMELIIQVLNDLLPNQQIEQLLLALNRQGQSILDHVLKSKGANPRLVNLLILGKLTKQNINKLLAHTIDNISQEFVSICTLGIRLGSHQLNSKKLANPSDFNNITLLLQRHHESKAELQNLYKQLITSILTVPNLYNYDINKLITYIWSKQDRSKLYSILSAVLPYYQQPLQQLANNNTILQILNQLTSLLEHNQTQNRVVKEPLSHIELLCTLTLNSTCRQQLLDKKAPIHIAHLLKSKTSILVKYNSVTMKLFLNLFQNTCIGTNCQDEFSQILIDLMTTLNDFNPIHHHHFIHQFFFPLINAFQGIPLLFLWKHKDNYLKQVTDVLHYQPIRSNPLVITHQGNFYHPLNSIDEQNLKHPLLFAEKGQQIPLYLLKQGTLSELANKKIKKHEFKDGNLTITVSQTQKIILSSDKYQAYEENQWEKNLLTNLTLTHMDNPWILPEKYHSILPIQSSTPEKVYFLPQEMTLNDLLKQINIGGLKIHTIDLPRMMVTNPLNSQNITLDKTIKQILASQKQPFVQLQIQASRLFASTTIESIAKEEIVVDSFVAQQTIFKAFEQKQGLEKLITTLKGCVKNWANAEQSNIWGQYLKQLESYSCFPIFSSLYINRQNNVGLLFDLLLSLPDKQDNKKWLQRQKQSVKELYTIIKDVFAVSGQQAIKVRQYALKSGFYSTMLQRLYMITKEPKRVKLLNQEIEEDQELPSLQKKQSEEEYKMKVEKKKGVGYGTDTSTNQKWDVTGQQQARKEKSQQILGLLNILEQFLDCQQFNYPPELLDQTFQSALLPILESSLRGGSLLEISKYAELFQGQLSFLQVVVKYKSLIPLFVSIPSCYQPKQPQSLHSLLKTLSSTSQIFISCLTGSASQKVSEQIAKKILKTYQIVDEAVSSHSSTHRNDEEQEKKIMDLPLPKKYPLLMKDLRFDYTNMKDSSNKITKHHYASNYQTGHKPPVDKTVRLAQELADISHALPIDHTNAIFVRCDKERVDFMQALIMGSNGTPYGHGAYLFDIYFEDTYPNNPPKVNLMTTGSGQVRFNPNLYACGKVCLSLLGTWRGQAMQNWDSKVSTLLQVLVSIQSIIMSEDIYFNQPGFEHQQGTVEGEKKNQAYANIVRYSNIKFAMLENIKNPPKGFQSIIRRHFYLKKGQILEECARWQKMAQKRQGSYTGLISDHNYNWCNTFKKSKTEYKTMLDKIISELEVQLDKLPPPTQQDFVKESDNKKIAKKMEKTKVNQTVIEEIDVSYGGAHEHMEMDINDEKVKDRWSRYIGAMGVEAVSKQSKASIVLLGIGALGVQIAKNIVLSGCRELAVWDDKLVSYSDLSGQFFLSEEQVGKSRLDCTFHKLQQLNNYVKMSKLQYHPSDFSTLKDYQVIIATERTHQQLLTLNAYCRQNSIHFLSVDCYGPYGQIFNDFGDKFEVIDKDGQETVQILIEDISIAQKGVLSLAKGQRHPYSDGDLVRIEGVKGMKNNQKEGLSINQTIHTIKVINSNSFEIGDTTGYSAYQGDGIARNMKTPSTLSFKSLQDSAALQNVDENLYYYDWAKNSKLKLLHSAFITLGDFAKTYHRLPLSWNKEDATNFVQLVKKRKAELVQDEIKDMKTFAYTCSGTFGSICALFGGIAAQQTFKAITGKYTPINQYFLAEFSEIIETPPEDQQLWAQYIKGRSPVQNRSQGLRTIIGEELLNKLQNSKVFMIGSGAIGCELLKNFAMLEIGAGEKGGSIVVTDPDHIQNSNLNRQFLFRQKHIRKPKSATASAVVAQMNPRLKGHIKARLDRVSQNTKQIYSNQFFEELTIVANALDNVQARRYVDSRCVENKIPLLQSGTLSSKGHVQVIIPYKTETYGNMQDPNDATGEIPHCTLKMFPEQTLHCVEWARDLFGKEFTLNPKALAKLLEEGQKYAVGPSDIQMLTECIKMVQYRPTNFDDAIDMATTLFYQLFRNDVMQLLFTYPRDAKTKDGKAFWKLPKRPPVPIEEIDPLDTLHSTFISSYAVLLAKIHNCPYPKDFRDKAKRQQLAKSATLIKVDPFIPSDKLAKEMAEEVDKDEANKEEDKGEIVQQAISEEDEHFLLNGFVALIKRSKQDGETIEARYEQFQKDDDQNGHIDLIYSMANLRARNYKLDQMDWITVKLKAGRIMPALSTTTSCIAALQTIELVKYIKGCPLDNMRNSFLNLAIPSFTMGQPGPVEQIKVHQNLTTNIWERWNIGPFDKTTTFGQLLKAIEDKYGVTVKGLNLAEGGQIYSDFVLSLQSKKEQKDKLLKKRVDCLVSEETGEDNMKSVDFTLVMGVGESMIKHAPTLRLLLQP